MGIFSSLFGSRPAEPEKPEPEVNEEEAPGVALEQLREALDSSEGALRVDGARALIERWRAGDLQAAEAIAPRLAELLEDSEPLVRLAALGGVRLLRKPENLEKCASAVVALLADAVPQVRVAAVWASLRLPGDAARTQVRALLDSAEETMRFAAACALSDARDPAALPELTAALHDDHRRQEALSALMSLGDAAALPEVARLFEEESLGEFDRTLVAAAMARFGDARGGAHLVERIEHNGDDRPIAAEWAGRLGVQEAVPALSELADEEGDPARGAAMRALGRLRAAGAEQRLLDVAGSDEFADDLRMDAAEGLAELGTPIAMELLKKLAEGEGSELSQLCRELLAEVAAQAS
ncbi:MAG: HEAT repeat domain-containing protein [Myxococcales bacterium]